MNTIKYGVFIGRFQPFHVGHQSIINKIIEDGLEPLVIIGSAQESDTEKNPYHYTDRDAMIRCIYPNIITKPLEDVDCWDSWHTSLLELLATVDQPETMTIYLHDKLEDLQNFTFRGKDYTNESYSKMYEVDGFNTVSLPISSIQIRAKAIRENLESNKQYLHPTTYNYIQNLNTTALSSGI